MKIIEKETCQVLFFILLMPLSLLFKAPQEQQVLQVTKRKIQDSIIAVGNFKGPLVELKFLIERHPALGKKSIFFCYYQEQFSLVVETYPQN